jgi:Arc/MetJ-type ribon-helix-helix transcriptional regulator
MQTAKHDRSILLRLTSEMLAQLIENRRMTGCNVSEFIRRAVNLALFADKQSANQNAAKREPAQTMPVLFTPKRETR